MNTETPSGAPPYASTQSAIFTNTEAPAVIQLLEANASVLWPRLMKSAHLATYRGEIVEDSRSKALFRFGVPDLIFRLQCQGERECGGRQNNIAGARIWRHVAEACKPGTEIPDITDLSDLNEWLPDSEQFPTVPKRGSCNSCGMPWDCVGTGGHVPVSESSTLWFCGMCHRQEYEREGTAKQQSAPTKRCKLGRKCLKKSGHTSGAIPEGSKSQFCSDDCRGRARIIQKQGFSVIS